MQRSVSILMVVLMFVHAPFGGQARVLCLGGGECHVEHAPGHETTEAGGCGHGCAHHEDVGPPSSIVLAESEHECDCTDVVVGNNDMLVRTRAADVDPAIAVVIAWPVPAPTLTALDIAPPRPPPPMATIGDRPDSHLAVVRSTRLLL